MQIRTRLTLLFTLNTAAILAGVLLYVWWSYKKQSEADFYRNLAARANMTVRTVLNNPLQLRPQPPRRIGLEDDPLPYLENISLYNNAYERVFTLETEAPSIAIKTLQRIQEQGEIRFRHRNLYAIGTLEAAGQGYNYMIVAEGYFDPAPADRLGRILAISFSLGLLGFAAMGWFLAGQALRPVSRIMNEVDALQPADLSRRVHTGEGKDELSRLAETFNRQLDRVEHAFRMQRMFLSNVSHELRNPLTSVRTQLDVALQRERSGEEYRQALQSVLDDMREISEVEEKLLLLAKVHNDPSAVQLEPVRIDELLWQTREQTLRRHPNSTVLLEYLDLPESEEQLLVQANESLLRTALVNLAENGCKYAPDHSVRLRLQCRTAGGPVLEIIDQGPGIPLEEQSLIFQPFYRSQRHRNVRGFGIGLSLVQTILQTHHISLEMLSPESGGTVFRLIFPED